MMDMESAKTTLGEGFAFSADIVWAQLKELDLPKSARILDVGTGGGHAAIALAVGGYQVVTGEPVEDRSEYAKQPWLEKARKVGADACISFQPFDAKAMPFDDGSFDGIFILGALHHMDDPVAALADCVRVLAPAGVLCIFEPTAKLVARAREKFPSHPDPTDPTPLISNMMVHTTHGELFDIYRIRHRS